MTGQYNTFLVVEDERLRYDVGFHSDWDRVRLTVHQDRYEDDPQEIEVWLTPQRAFALSTALQAAARNMESE